MRVLSYLQVLLLLGLLAYLLLVALENPSPVHFPLPLGRGEWLLSGGLAMGLFLLIGAGYAALLLLPTLWTWNRARRTERQAYRHLEERLASTLQARLASLPAEKLPIEKARE